MSVRCDRHEDAYYPVKCEACESLTREYELFKLEPPAYPQYKMRTTEQNDERIQNNIVGLQAGRDILLRHVDPLGSDSEIRGGLVDALDQFDIVEQDLKSMTKEVPE